ncbi:Phosphatidylserine synthase, putative [Perkinsus marinus ATCC 50983]|uniref:Phosphatidylserine synthase, putative n=2 Tax=Perkinsus marinus (strain ATCC 50983 / TXsc) TaxID=423536 RepID=C5KSX4_PERM5|nr:Phosphatidylserine synthase, putative [Perkinsus marinus ATCC 50983]EER12324.1 Phosphatidylserine synthase, putative [Perkinsus marinus ATCC 50983]|eukprot:XP_002780529.1 Phosphatidylserine synthase, putative [Perkinsus marinus ATCC 50983]
MKSSSSTSKPLHGRGAPPMGPMKMVEEESQCRPRVGSIGSPTNASRKDRIYNQEYEDAIANLEHRPVPDITVPWFYESHSLFVLGAAMVMIYYYTIKHGGDAETNDLSQNLVRGLPYVVALYLVVGLFAFPSGPFVRPHPAVWKIVFGLNFLYLLAVVWALFLTPEQLRNLLHGLDPSMGEWHPLPFYAEDCDLTWGNVMSKMDIFVFGHFFGWIAKGLLFRNRMFCWFFSIGWEFVEKSLVFAVPNFAECWWDSWIMDVLLCNGIGIEIGLYLCNYLEFKEYHWSSIFDAPTLSAKLKRSVMQFTPESWMHVEWEDMLTVKRYFGMQLMMLVCMLVDLNLFMLKLNLYIPTEHPFVLGRLGLMILAAIPTVRQYYMYMLDPKVTRLGTQCLVCTHVFCLTIVSEDVLIFKTLPELPPIPKENMVSWLVPLHSAVHPIQRLDALEAW